MIEHYTIPLGIIAFIWGVYFAGRYLDRKARRIIDLHASLNEQRKNLAEALALMKYGAWDEGVALLREHFDLPQDGDE